MVKRREVYVLVRDERDRDEVEAKYLKAYLGDGDEDEVFVRREWLRFELSNDVLARNGQDKDESGYSISYVY